MPEAQLRQSAGTHLCGLAGWHPAWLQRYATTKMFMGVYGLLGTIQAMSYMYFVVTLTTIEKRFKIPSQTTGIILSGNEISQILLSLILSYIGGQRNRPRWIAWGIVFCGISCYILALPHFVYGAGDDALRLTKEYVEALNVVDNVTSTLPLVNMTVTSSQQLCSLFKSPHECEALLSIMPLILIFLSQFVLGVGNTLYYSLGQTYLDDNTKKTNTPLMLAVAMSLRMIGPIVGFVLGYFCLNMFIDPTRTPLIDNKDSRWLGAWWFGWMILGTLMIVFSGLIGLFPTQLPKKKPEYYNSHLPKMMRVEELQADEGIPLGSTFSLNAALETPAPADAAEFPTLKDFPKALMRLLRNKLLIYNIVSGVFYILGAAGYITFLSKYMEVQFHKNASEATIVVGPLSIIGMVIGIIGSGLVISKKRPSPSKVLMWNVIVGFIYILGQCSYMFMYCGDSISVSSGGKFNFTTECNANCFCDDVSYSPVCHEASDTTYYSACHAGCHTWNAEDKTFSNCSCMNDRLGPATTAKARLPSFLQEFSTERGDYEQPKAQQLQQQERQLLPITTLEPIPNALGLYAALPHSAVEIAKTIATTTTTTTTTATPANKTLVTLNSSTSSSTKITTQTPKSTRHLDDENVTTPMDTTDNAEDILTRARRTVDDTISQLLTPGVCMKGCNIAFYSFAIASTVVNWFGSSGRIGNILVNYRAVSTADKSFAQGLSLMLVSLFALIPGPIIFGRIIDSTCLVWTKTCSGNGNCQLHDQAKFRYYVNALAMLLTTIGVFFDVLVWYHGRHLDLYGEKEIQRLEEEKRKKKALTPLLAQKS